MKKLYLCEVGTVVYVMAENDIQAEQLALRFWHDEPPCDVTVQEVSVDHRPVCDWDDCIPYDGEGDRTVGQIMESKAQKISNA